MRIINVIRNPLGAARRFRDRNLEGTPYWERRAKLLGERAVFNASHPPDRLAEVTAMQKRILYPWFCEALDGSERHVLDFGCGTGRFTPDLAGLIEGVATGIDPIDTLIDLAPAHEHVTYKRSPPGCVTLPTDSVDAVWVCLVLGGIADGSTLLRTARELERVLRAGGLLFIVENTSAHSSGNSHWRFRPASDYIRLFPGVPLEPIGHYTDLDDELTALAGRAIG